VGDLAEILTELLFPPLLVLLHALLELVGEAVWIETFVARLPSEQLDRVCQVLVTEQ
jgi:hypothetical protein